jgi:DNA-binding beta-propeller fold protein YncE
MLSRPDSVWISAPDGNLYVVSGMTNRVVKFDPLTGTSLGDFVSSGSGGLSGAIGVEFGPDGNLYVASLNTDIVDRYNWHNRRAARRFCDGR